MSRRPAKERAPAPARRLPVLESLGRDEEEWLPVVGGTARKGRAVAAFCRMALRLVK
jgi:hypothetical protein